MYSPFADQPAQLALSVTCVWWARGVPMPRLSAATTTAPMAHSVSAARMTALPDSFLCPYLFVTSVLRVGRGRSRSGRQVLRQEQRGDLTGITGRTAAGRMANAR